MIASLLNELQDELTGEEREEAKQRVQFLSSEAEKLLRSRIPHDIVSPNVGVELWGYEQIEPLSPAIYIHHHQPTQTDFDLQFQLPEGEVWAWNVVYTLTGPYFGVQNSQDGEPATRFSDLGPINFFLQTVEVLKGFAGFDLLGDLSVDNLDGFTLEFDECQTMYEALQRQGDQIGAALSQLIQGEENYQHAQELVDLWAKPLASGMKQGIAQFKRGKTIGLSK
ncbi:hypothetical protein [Gloeothece verrucosa]|uniref:hypothetical protein n=1 Tax=Gloeothece verrucosa TaxID=2546359 RepID=UPI0003260B37|nr:hypothetical protein [Gloeothece verrucosa]